MVIESVKRFGFSFWGFLLLSFLYPSGVLFGQGQAPVYAIWGDPEAGREVYARKACASCHAINGVGGTIGPDLAVAKKSRTITQIAGVMWNHAPEMRRVAREKGIRWQEFKGAEMRDLISYLYFLRALDRSGSPRRGARLFDEKRCSTCHAVAGKGSKVGPDLSRWKQYESPILWAEIMWKHAVEMEIKMDQMGLPWPKFQENEMVDLIEYIKSQAAPGK